MPNTSTLADDFNDGALGAAWSASHGNVGEAGGRAFVECGGGFPAISTADAYTLDSFLVQVFSATRSAATTEASTGVWVQSPSVPGGTDIGFAFDAVNEVVSFRSRSGYFDGGSVDLAHVPGSGIWLRLRIVGTDALWDTSADGVTWTNRRTAAAPAWVLAATDVRVLFEAHRSDGGDNFAEVDNFNVPPVIHDATATVDGVGALTGTAAVTRAATATVAGVGALGGSAAVTRAAAAPSAGVGGLATAAAVTRAATAVSAGVGALSVTAQVIRPVVPALTAAATVRTVSGTATVRVSSIGGTAAVR